MYKNTSDSRDFRERVGSHSTKGTSTRGVVSSGTFPEMPEVPVDISELAFEEVLGVRNRLVACKLVIQKAPPSSERSREMLRIDEALTSIKARIKDLGMAKRPWSHFVAEAFGQLADEDMMGKVIARAKELRGQYNEQLKRGEYI